MICEKCGAEVNDVGDALCVSCLELLENEQTFAREKNSQHEESTSPTKKAGARPSLVDQLYNKTDFWRRSNVCSLVIVAHLLLGVLINFVPAIFPISVVTALGVVAIAVSVLTGPIYYKELEFTSGELKQWAPSNKNAAIVIIALFVAGYAFLVYKLYLT